MGFILWLVIGGVVGWLASLIMRTDGQLSDGEFSKLDEEQKVICQDAWDFADASPEPSPEDLYTDVLVDTTS